MNILVKQEAITDLSLVSDEVGFVIKNKPIQKVVKRLLDIVLSSFAIVALAPLFLLLIVLIKIDSKGAAIFTQERVGLGGKLFNMYKFRSMVVNAEDDFEKVKSLNESNGIMFKAKNDPRITRVGRFIRKYSLDELPQLFNILKGEMSIVGPRPPLQREVDNYKHWHFVKFQGMPGLTGLWQISGRADIQDFDEVIGLDYKYLKNWNILKDFLIILKTVPVVLLADGAA